MKPSLFILALLFFASPMFVTVSATGPRSDWNEKIPVFQILKELGDPMPLHYLPQRDEQMIQQGKDIVQHGKTRGPDGTATSVQSQFFLCTDCHNTRREDPDLRKSDPETRLDYAIQHKLRLLPGTTFYGIVNRTSWYNDDYQKKYGESAAHANKDLANAIQLCATQCAMGRILNDWEVQAILAYFWSLEFTLEDLDLSQSDWKKLKLASVGSHHNQELISWLKGLYLKASPATFSRPPTPILSPNSSTPNIERGKAIYVLSCLGCHRSGGITSFTLANSAITYQLLNDHTHFSANFSVYNAIRNGIKASPGKGYMPNYPLERMSNNQIKDLWAFIDYQATHSPLSLKPLIDWIN